MGKIQQSVEAMLEDSKRSAKLGMVIATIPFYAGFFEYFIAVGRVGT